MKILSWIKNDQKPFLGICRGEQFLNVAFGGSLIQHLPEKTTESHNVGAYASLGEVMHEVEIEPDSRLFTIINKDNITVNSGHHQAIDRVGEGLWVVARTKQGVIEAIEGVDKSQFLLGVQWHPEADQGENSAKIFAAFAQSVV